METATETKMKKKVFPGVTIVHYFGFLTFAFYFIGVVLFFICMTERLHPMQLEVMSSPVHYFILATFCLIVFLYNKYHNQYINNR